MSFALRLCQIKLELQEDLDEDLFTFLLSGGDANLSAPQNDLDYLNEHQLSVFTEFIKENPSYKHLWNELSDNRTVWEDVIESPNFEDQIPISIHKQDPDHITSWLERLIILKCFRLDRFSSAVGDFVNRVFGTEFIQREDYELSNVVERESHSKSPLIFCCATGFDASTMVDDLASQMNIRKYKAIALGSPEGFDLAEDALNNGVYYIKSLYQEQEVVTGYF